jgi:hypothetical protein
MQALCQVRFMKMSKYSIPLNLEENKYLLINTRTGVIDVVDRDVIDLLHGEKTEADPSILNLLKDGGHLTAVTPQEEITT